LNIQLVGGHKKPTG